MQNGNAKILPSLRYIRHTVPHVVMKRIVLLHCHELEFNAPSAILHVVFQGIACFSNILITADFASDAINDAFR